jgi:hypothetical protein
MKLKISKSIIFLALYVVLTAVIIVLGIIPGISELSADRKELADGSATLSGYQDKIADLSKFNKNKAEIDTVDKVISGLLPKDKDSSDFVVKMETLGNELSIQCRKKTRLQRQTKKQAQRLRQHKQLEMPPRRRPTLLSPCRSKQAISIFGLFLSGQSHSRDL